MSASTLFTQTRVSRTRSQVMGVALGTLLAFALAACDSKPAAPAAAAPSAETAAPATSSTTPDTMGTTPNAIGAAK